jgi:hypothetical protein
MMNCPFFAPSTFKYHQQGQPRSDRVFGVMWMTPDFLSMDFTFAEPPGKSVVTAMSADSVSAYGGNVAQKRQAANRNFISILGS